MVRPRQFRIKSARFVTGIVAVVKTLAQPVAIDPSRLAPEILSQSAAKIVAEEIPREYERKKDWGKTKEVTTGVRSSGNFFKFDIHRQKSAVNHGTWKHYRLTLVEPDRTLVVNIENMRTLESGRVALTLNVAAKVHGWARAKMYDRGIHIIALEPGKKYELGLNSFSHKNFSSKWGVPLEPVRFTFTTAGGEAEGDAAEAEAVNDEDDARGK